MLLRNSKRASADFIVYSFVARREQAQARRLDAILQFADDLTLTDDISPIHIKTRDDSDNGAGELDDLLRLDHAFELCCACT